MTDKPAIIRTLFAAYLANDREGVDDCFTEDFLFTSPYDDAIDKRTYFERCWRVSDWIERHDLERIVVDGDAVFVTYRCVAKGGKTFRNTEFFRFEGDKIRSIDVYFGATYQPIRCAEAILGRLPKDIRCGHVGAANARSSMSERSYIQRSEQCVSW